MTLGGEFDRKAPIREQIPPMDAERVPDFVMEDDYALAMRDALHSIATQYGRNLMRLADVDAALDAYVLSLDKTGEPWRQGVSEPIR